MKMEHVISIFHVVGHDRKGLIWTVKHFILGKRESKALTSIKSSQPAIICSKLTIETLEQGVKYVQS